MFNFDFDCANERKFYTSEDLGVYKVSSNKYGIIIFFNNNLIGEEKINSIKINNREYKMPIFLIKKENYYILIIMKSEFKMEC